MPSGHTAMITAPFWHSSVTESSVVLPPDSTGTSMPDPQMHALSPRAAARPRCLKCQSRMEVQRITAARSGFEHWTLRCIKCGLVREAQVNADPMKSDVIGWEHSDLRAPQ
jgi:hypothetical protein